MRGFTVHESPCNPLAKVNGMGDLLNNYIIVVARNMYIGLSNCCTIFQAILLSTFVIFPYPSTLRGGGSHFFNQMKFPRLSLKPLKIPLW